MWVLHSFEFCFILINVRQAIAQSKPCVVVLCIRGFRAPDTPGYLALHQIDGPNKSSTLHKKKTHYDVRYESYLPWESTLAIVYMQDGEKRVNVYIQESIKSFREV